MQTRLMYCPVCDEQFVARFSESYGAPPDEDFPCSPECNLKSL